MTSPVQSEIKNVWAIAWPVILTNLLNVSVGIVDYKMVGVLGVESIAAVGVSRHVMMLLMVLMMAIGGGASILVAHAYGAKDQRQVGLLAARSVFFMMILSLLIITPLGIIFSGTVLRFLGGEAAVIEIGIAYLRILFCGTLFTALNFGLSGILLGVGKTRISLVLLAGVNLANIALNYLFIFGAGPVPALGVTGAALGTVSARMIGSIAGIWILKTPRIPIQARFREGFSLDWPMLRQLLQLGGPRSLQGMIRNSSRMLTFRIITLLPDSTQSISAYSVAIQVRMISGFLGLAFMSAALSRVGQNMGAGRPDLAEKSGWIAAGMAFCTMSVFAVIFFVFPETIMAFFTTDPTVISVGKTFFVVVALTEPVMAFAFALGGALRGGGDSFSPFLYGSISDLLIAVGLGYVFAIVMKMGFVGIPIALAISAFGRAIPSIGKFKKGEWKKNELILNRSVEQSSPEKKPLASPADKTPLSQANRLP